MKKFLPLFAVALVAAMPATAQAANANESATAVAVKGKMVVDSTGARLGAVYRVAPDGSAQILIDGKLVTVPASTLSSTDGKIVTSLKKAQLLSAR